MNDSIILPDEFLSSMQTNSESEGTFTQCLVKGSNTKHLKSVANTASDLSSKPSSYKHKHFVVYPYHAKPTDVINKDLSISASHKISLPSTQVTENRPIMLANANIVSNEDRVDNASKFEQEKVATFEPVYALKHTKGYKKWILNQLHAWNGDKTVFCASHEISDTTLRRWRRENGDPILPQGWRRQKAAAENKNDHANNIRSSKDHNASNPLNNTAITHNHSIAGVNDQKMPRCYERPQASYPPSRLIQVVSRHTFFTPYTNNSCLPHNQLKSNSSVPRPHFIQHRESNQFNRKTNFLPTPAIEDNYSCAHNFTHKPARDLVSRPNPSAALPTQPLDLENLTWNIIDEIKPRIIILKLLFQHNYSNRNELAFIYKNPTPHFHTLMDGITLPDYDVQYKNSPVGETCSVCFTSRQYNDLLKKSKCGNVGLYPYLTEGNTDPKIIPVAIQNAIYFLYNALLADCRYTQMQLDNILPYKKQ